ncbi:hypothetical protein Zmor_016745 [Zophobas morio]|uniref:Uncharacterized protein n=1 Tax=Zophobas morio TaxID=2755281 RepID=A0AA38MBA2_9CUCU|nr:hypothetical protein Zmor_016745 [Zophobas morio]
METEDHVFRTLGIMKRRKNIKIEYLLQRVPLTFLRLTQYKTSFLKFKTNTRLNPDPGRTPSSRTFSAKAQKSRPCVRRTETHLSALQPSRSSTSTPTIAPRRISQFPLASVHPDPRPGVDLQPGDPLL